MIDVEAIPQISPAAIDRVAANARSLQDQSGLIRESGETLSSTWQNLPAVFATPDTDSLVQRVWPVSTTTNTLGADLVAIGLALQAYADAVAPIARQLATLKAAAKALSAKMFSRDDWRDDEIAVDFHNDLISSVNTQVAAWNDAERECANRIDALYFGVQFVQDNGDGSAAPNEYGYSSDALDQAAADSTSGLPWGTDETANYGFFGTGAQFFVGLADGVWSGIKGLGALTGIEGGDAFKAGWTGVGNLAGLNGVVNQALAWKGAFVAATDWDEWKSNPGRALGEVASNFIPTPTVAAKFGGFALKAGGVGLKAAKDSAWAAKATEYLNKIPTMGDLSKGAAEFLHGNNPWGPKPALAGTPNGVTPPPHTWSIPKALKFDSRSKGGRGRQPPEPPQSVVLNDVPYSPNDPAQLRAYEKPDLGHTAGRHVGLSDQDLIDRNKVLASTFPDLATASSETARNLWVNQAKIDAYLHSDRTPPQSFFSTLEAGTGRTYIRETGQFVPSEIIQTVIAKGASPGEWYILTSFPDLRASLAK